MPAQTPSRRTTSSPPHSPTPSASPNAPTPPDHPKPCTVLLPPSPSQRGKRDQTFLSVRIRAVFGVKGRGREDLETSEGDGAAVLPLCGWGKLDRSTKSEEREETGPGSEQRVASTVCVACTSPSGGRIERLIIDRCRPPISSSVGCRVARL